MSKRNPFRKRAYGIFGGHVEAVDAVSRIDMVRSFNPFKCNAALRVPGLQATVRQAIERRLRELARGRRS